MQRTNRPVPKVLSAGVAGAIVTIIIAVLAIFDIDISPEVGAAAATLIAFAAGFITPPAGLGSPTASARGGEVVRERR